MSRMYIENEKDVEYAVLIAKQNYDRFIQDR
jgi:hypothetical protein